MVRHSIVGDSRQHPTVDRQFGYWRSDDRIAAWGRLLNIGYNRSWFGLSPRALEHGKRRIRIRPRRPNWATFNAKHGHSRHQSQTHHLLRATIVECRGNAAISR